MLCYAMQNAVYTYLHVSIKKVLSATFKIKLLKLKSLLINKINLDIIVQSLGFELRVIIP